MAKVVETIFKLKRGTATRWEEINPILAQGEPGFVYDSHRLKIGDGITPWNDLPYIEEKTEVISYDSIEDFPIGGDPNVIYKAAKELSLYQFNVDTYKYEKISDGKALSDIIEPYTAGSGLNLQDNQFSINIADDSEAYLSTNAEGLKITGITDAIIESLNIAKGYAEVQSSQVLNEAKASAANIYATKAFVGVIPEGYSETSIISYIDKKTSEISDAYESRITSLEKLSFNYDSLKEIVDNNTQLLSQKANNSDLEVLALDFKNDIEAMEALINEEENRAKSAESDLTKRLVAIETFWEAAKEDSQEENVINTLREIQDYIASDESGASAILANIKSNSDAIAMINDDKTGILAMAKDFTISQIATIPTATDKTLGLIKIDNNTVKMNQSNQLYVNKISTDMLEQGEQTIVLNGGNSAI